MSARGSDAGALRCLQLAADLDLDQGGISRFVIDLSRGLVRHGIETTVAASRLGSARAALADGPDAPHVVSLERGFWLRRRSLDALLARADVVHLHGPWWPAYPAIARAVSRRGMGLVLSPHGALGDWSMSQGALKKRLYLRLVARRAIERSVLVCTAERERVQALTRVTPRASLVIPPVIHPRLLDALAPSSDASERWPHLAPGTGPMVLFVGRVHPKKGLDVALRALALVPDAELSIAGPDEANTRSAMTRLAAELGVEQRTHWLGAVHDEALRSLLAASDVLVLPTLAENFGLVLAEALGAGLAVVTTDGTDAWPELARSGAQIVARTPEAFADAITRIDRSASSRSARLLAQRARLSEWLAPEPVVALYAELYARWSAPSTRVD